MRISVGMNSRKFVQHGSAMILALLALLVLSMSAVALIRSTDSGTTIIGNIGFKQDTTDVSAIGAEAAMVWINSHMNDGLLDADQLASGYYASSLDKLDPTGANTSSTNKLPLVDWDGSCNNAKSGTYSTCTTVPFTSTAVNGNKIQWVITRLCDSVGAPSALNLCSRPVVVGTSTANDRGDLSAGGRISGSVASPYYRIIVKSTGPRNTASFTESIVHF